MSSRHFDQVGPFTYEGQSEKTKAMAIQKSLYATLEGSPANCDAQQRRCGRSRPRLYAPLWLPFVVFLLAVRIDKKVVVPFEKKDLANGPRVGKKYFVDRSRANPDVSQCHRNPCQKHVRSPQAQTLAGIHSDFSNSTHFLNPYSDSPVVVENVLRR